VTNIRRDLFEKIFAGQPFEIRVDEMRIKKISRSYDENAQGSPLAIWGSEACLEISANLSSAARMLGIETLDKDDTKIVIRKEGVE
jgi:S-adenosylmethionine hydrolase